MAEKRVSRITNRKGNFIGFLTYWKSYARRKTGRWLQKYEKIIVTLIDQIQPELVATKKGL